MPSNLIVKSTCSCCEDEIFNIPLESDCVSYDPEFGFVVHFSRDEMQSLYLEMKEELLHS